MGLSHMTLWKWASSPEEEAGGGARRRGGGRLPTGTVRVDARQLEEALGSRAETAPEADWPLK